MSIAAVIEAVTILAPSHCDDCNSSGKADNGWDLCDRCHGASKDNPAVRLLLGPIDKGVMPGQPVLTIVNPPTLDPAYLKALVGTKIWGGSSEIMIGETKFADRIGYTRIKLV